MKDGMEKTKTMGTIGRPPVAIDFLGREVALPVHRAFLESSSKRRLLCFHRRARKTSIALEEVMKYLAANPGIIGMSLAPERKQAKMAIWDDPDMLFNPSILPPVLIADINRQDLSVKLKNGSIYYLDGADEPRNKKGTNAKILHLTEIGDHKPEIWFEVYSPILEANGGILIGEGTTRPGWWNRLFNDAGHWKGWETFFLPATESPIFTPEQLEKIRAETPDAIYRSEYLCEWLEASGQVFRNVRETARGTPCPPNPSKRYRMGLDLAKHQDWTVMSVVDLHTWDQVYLERFNKIDWVLQKSRIEAVCRRYNNASILLDSTGIGDPIYDDLLSLGLPVRGYQFTTASKMKLVHHLSKLMDDGSLTFINDIDLVREFNSYKYKKLPSEAYSYSAPDGEHDDCVTATMLSFWNLVEKLPAVLPVGENDVVLREGWDILKTRKVGELPGVFRTV